MSDVKRIEILENGEVVNTIFATEEFAEETFPGNWRVAEAIELPTERVQSRMSVLAFRLRFTAAEKAAIELAAVHTPEANMEAQLKAASIRAYMADLSVADFVDTQRDVVRGGTEILEFWGYLGDGRSAEILDTPIKPSELP